MKIVRIEEANSNQSHAELKSDGKCYRIDGNIFKTPTVSDVEIKGKLLSPITPVAIFCIGLNYRKHAEETGAKIPKWPVVFAKGPGSVVASGDNIVLPRTLRSDKVDYEGELAIVIGKTCKNVKSSEALSYVLGYCCGNDVSARDWQKEKGGGQYCRGKMFDTFCPLGPHIVTTNEIPNPNLLELKTYVNGELLQQTNTSDMIFDVATIIEFLSGSTTLPAGTVILTGTPSGVGMAAQPQRWLHLHQ